MDDYKGAIDTQTNDQKAENYSFNEVVLASAPVLWEERMPKRLPFMRSQNGSGSCVCATYATELAIIFKQKYGEWVDFSYSYPYQKRGNTSVSGSTSVDIYSIFPKIGDVFESFMPSDDLNDIQMMSIRKAGYIDDLAKTFTIKRISLPIDFDAVASTVQQTGKGIMVWFKFSGAEWQTVPVVLPQPTTSGHSVTVIDAILRDGKKYLVIQDSWGLAHADNGLRYISEEYFNARCFLASYLLSFKLEQTIGERPHFDGTVKSAQKCFKWEGLFPLNVDEIESWGNITTGACAKFQKRYGIEPAFGFFGNITKSKLSELYN